MREAEGRGTPFDLAVVDLMMPGLSGLEVGRAAAADRRLRRIPLLMLTAADRDVDAAEVRAAGFEACLGKPARPSALFDAVMRATRGSAAEPAREATADGPARHRGNVLLAEDNPVNQAVACELLRDAGYRVRVVGDGLLAVEALTRPGGHGFDVVLMDCQMPELDGFGATRRFRDHEAARTCGGRVPIVALTANAVRGDRERCLEAGMDGYASKPIDCDALFREMESLMRPLAERNPPMPEREEDPLAKVAGAGRPEAAATPAVDRRVDPAEEVIDLPAVLARCGGKAPLVSRLLGAFAVQLPEQVGAARVHLAEGDDGALRRVAHAVKGTAANLSAVPLAEAAACLESAPNAEAVEAFALEARTAADRASELAEALADASPAARAA